MVRSRKKPGARPTTTRRTGADRPLSAKQEEMVLNYLIHGKKYLAYKEAFDTTQEGKNLYVVAWKEFDKPNVKRRFHELQDLAVFEHLVTKETLAHELDEARELALRVNAPAAAVSAATVKAKLYGQIIDKVQAKISTPDGQPLIPAKIQIEVVHVSKKSK